MQSTTEILDNILVDIKKALDVESTAVTTQELSTKEILENVLLDIKRALDIESTAVVTREPSKTETLQNILVDIKKAGYVESAALATRDGLLMASNFPSRSEAEIFAATSANMLGAAESATTEFGKGIPNRVIVEFKGAKMIVIGSGPKALLAVSILSDAKLGSILIKLENSASRIREILK